MYCNKCGKELQENAGFCSQCGSVCNAQSNASGPKKHHRLTALVITLILLLAAFSGVFLFKDKLTGQFSKEEDVYSEVDEILENTLAGTEFQNAEISEKKDIIQKTLNDMEKSGKIKENCIMYSDEDNYVFYEYINGAKGFVTLEDFADNTVGDYLLDCNYKKLCDVNTIDLDLPQKMYEEEDLSALVLYGLGQPFAEDNIKKLQKSWNNNNLSTDIDDNVTVGKLMTELEGYDFIYILLHGNYQPKFSDTQLIFLEEKSSSKKDCEEYSKDLLKGNIIHNNTKKGTYYVVTGDFFRDYYSEGKKLDNSIVFVGCCRGYCKNDNLVSQFAECGAKSVIGSTETVWTDYEMLIINDLVYRLLCGDTVQEALDYAKLKSGKDGLEFFEKHYMDNFSMLDNSYIKEIYIHQEFKIYEGYSSSKNSTLVTLTDAARTVLKDSENNKGTTSGLQSDASETSSQKSIPSDAVSLTADDNSQHFYYIYSDVCSTWEEAEAYCKAMGGHLAVIDNAEENEFIYNYMIDQGYRNAYFGYTDKDNEGTWNWVTDSANTYTNWHSGEPNSENENEDYAMFYYQFSEGTWNDGNFAGSAGKTFICEWDEKTY